MPEGGIRGGAVRVDLGGVAGGGGLFIRLSVELFSNSVAIGLDW